MTYGEYPEIDLLPGGLLTPVTEEEQAEIEYMLSLEGEALELYTNRKLWEISHDNAYLGDLQYQAYNILKGTGEQDFETAFVSLDDETALEYAKTAALLAEMGVDIRAWFEDGAAWMAGSSRENERIVYQSNDGVIAELAASFKEFTSTIAAYLMRGEEAIDEDMNKPGIVEWLFFGSAMETAGMGTLDKLIGTFFEETE